MKKLVAFTGSGISAESGIQTFRGGPNAMWAGYDLNKVATHKGWQENKQYALNFYNERRRELRNVSPNLAHKFLAELERYYDVSIVTQNVDDLHERAGSSSVVHLHGDLTKARNETTDEIVEVGYDSVSPESNLRPHVVWFGEDVLHFDQSLELFKQADIVLVIGTSLLVQPAASLLTSMKKDCEWLVVDPDENPVFSGTDLANGAKMFHCRASLRIRPHVFINKTAVESVPELRKYLCK